MDWVIGQLWLVVFLAYQLSTIYLVMRDSCLLYHVSFTPIIEKRRASTTHLDRDWKCLIYWLIHWPAVVRLAPRFSIINNPSCPAGFLPVVPCLLHSHHEKNQSINHASSSRLQMFDVMTYSLANCGLTCSSLMNDEQSIMSCGIPASWFMYP
jgi:hypothetical protein